jgi:hypothetical protein
MILGSAEPARAGERHRSRTWRGSEKEKAASLEAAFSFVQDNLGVDRFACGNADGG